MPERANWERITFGIATCRCPLWANSGHLCSRVNLWRYGGKYIVGRHGATDALKRKIANWFDVDGIFNRHQDTRTNQDLPWLGFVAKPGRDIGHRSDGGVIETSLKTNGAERRKSVRDTNAKAKLMSQPTPFLSQRFNRHAHLKRRLHGL